MLRDIINRDLVTVEPDAPIDYVAKLMAENDVGSVVVLTDGKPRGILTDRDIVLRCIAKNVDVSDTTAENILSESVETVQETAGLMECIEKMHRSGVRRMPVVDSEGNAVGIVSFGDLVGILSRELSQLTERTTRRFEAEQEEERAA